MKKNEELVRLLNEEYRNMEDAFDCDMRLEDYERKEMWRYSIVMECIDNLFEALKAVYKEDK